MLCDASEFNGEYMAARIASVFVLLVVSAAGSFFPLLANRYRMLAVPPLVLFGIKYFGSGVILATAYIHLLGEAQDSLSSPCLGGIFEEYSWALAIALMGTFTMFTIELVVQARRNRVDGDDETGGCGDCNVDEIKRELEHSRAVSAKITNIFLLEFGIVFHLVFVGLSLAIAGDQFPTLFVAIAFHQFFEGLGLGARFAGAEWPARLAAAPWWLSLAYTITTPAGIAAGLGVRHLYLSSSATSLIVVGVFDAFCAGLLIYNSLVDLLARDFFETLLRQRGTAGVLLAYVMLFLGTFCMAIIGKWA